MTASAIALLAYAIVLIAIAFRSLSKVKTSADFLVAGKKSSTLSVASSLIATILGGSAVIGAIDRGRDMLGATAWFMLVGALGLFCLVPLAKKSYALGGTSLTDLMGNLFGDRCARASASIIPLAWLGITAAQVIAGAKILQGATDLTYEVCALLVASLFTAYTWAGGQISILKTDGVQTLLILGGLFLVAICAFTANPLNHAFIGGQTTEDAMVFSGAIEIHSGSTILLGFPFNPAFTPIDLFILALTYGSTFAVGPDMHSRILCARDDTSAKRAVLIAAIVLIPTAFLIGFLSVASATIDPSIPGARIFLLAQRVLPPALLPLLTLSLFSVVLSSADTTLLSCAIIAERWLPTTTKPPSSSSSPTKSMGERDRFRRTRWCIFIAGLTSLFIALMCRDVIGVLLLALTAYAGAFTVPILMGLWVKDSKTIPARWVASAMVTGWIMAMVGKLAERLFPLSNAGDTCLILAFVISGLILFLGIKHR